MADNSTASSKSLNSQVPEWAREIAIIRVEILKRFDEFFSANSENLGIKKAMGRYCELFNKGLIDNEVRQRWGAELKKLGRSRQAKLSVHMLKRWKRQRKKDGLRGLIESYGNPPRTNAGVLKAIERFIWNDHLARYQDIFDYLPVLAKKGEFSEADIPSYSTVLKNAKAYREEHWGELVLHHEGKKGLRDRNMEPALGVKDESLTRPNERWELDTTIADLFTGERVHETVLITPDGKRLKVLGIIDVFSRCVRFWLVERETGFMVGQVIKDRIAEWGIPDEIVIDNGATYKNRRILRGLKDLGISCHICIPGNPVEKPFIERAFRTLTEGVFRRLTGFSGNSVANRPKEIRIKHSKAEAQAIIDRFVENKYHERIHRGTGQRPRERMSPPGFEPKTIDARELDLFFLEEFERTVIQGCISFMGGRFFHPSLPDTCKVKVRANDLEASELMVFYGDQLLCVAEDLRFKGKTIQDIREAKKARNTELRTRIKAHEALISKDVSRETLFLEEIDYRQKRKPLGLPKRAEVVPLRHPTGGAEAGQDAESNGVCHVEEGGARPIQNRQQYYLFLVTKKQAGEALDTHETEWLKEYLDSDEYRMIGAYLEEQIQGRCAQ